MANETCIPSAGRWIGDVHLKTEVVQSAFEMFPSGGGSSLLFGKLLLEQFKAVRDYRSNTIYLPKDNGEWDMLVGSTLEASKVDSQIEKSVQTLLEVDKPTLRQIFLSNPAESE